MPGPGSFDANATSTSLQPGQNISDDTSTLYAMLGLSATEGAAPVLLKRVQNPQVDFGDSLDYVQAHPYSPEVKASLGQAIQGFYSLDEMQRSQVQRRLLSGGFYSSTNNLLAGRPDDDTVRAYAAAAKQSVITGKTLDETIDAAAGAVKDDDVNKLLSNGGAGATGTTRAPFSPVVTNPLDIRDTAQSVATKTLGRKFSDAELARFVSVYQQMETGAQHQDYAAQTAGGTTTKQPGLEAAAEAQARNVAPVEAGAHDVAGIFDMFQSMLTGGM